MRLAPNLVFAILLGCGAPARTGAGPCGFASTDAFVRALDEVPAEAGPSKGRRRFGSCELENAHGTRTVVSGQGRVYELTRPGWRGAYDPRFATDIGGLRVGMLGREARARMDALGFARMKCTRYDSWRFWQCSFARTGAGHDDCDEPAEFVQFAILSGDPDPEEDPVDEEAATLVADRKIIGIVLHLPCGGG